MIQVLLSQKIKNLKKLNVKSELFRFFAHQKNNNIVGKFSDLYSHLNNWFKLLKSDANSTQQQWTTSGSEEDVEKVKWMREWDGNGKKMK